MREAVLQGPLPQAFPGMHHKLYVDILGWSQVEWLVAVVGVDNP